MFITIFNFVTSIFASPIDHHEITITIPEDEIEIVWLEDCQEMC